MLSHLESERLMPLLVKQVKKKLSHGHCCLQLCWAASCVFFPGVFLKQHSNSNSGNSQPSGLASTIKSRTQPRRNGCVNALLASLGRLSGDISNNQRQKSFVSSREVAGNGLLGYDASGEGDGDGFTPPSSFGSIFFEI